VKAEVCCILTCNSACGPVLPIKLSVTYLNLILLEGSVIQQEFVEVFWLCLLKKLDILQQNKVQKRLL